MSSPHSDGMKSQPRANKVVRSAKRGSWAKVRLEGGHLEKIVDNVKDPAREPLLWQDAFFGKRTRRRVWVGLGFQATNSPLILHPEILDEVTKYVFLPKDVQAAYRET